MAHKGTRHQVDKKTGRTLRQKLWLKYYLDCGNKTTFLNKTESAKAAGYNCTAEISYSTIGCENYSKLKNDITVWIDEHGLGEDQLKLLLVDGLTANETKFFAHEGVVIDSREVKNWSARKQYLELAMKHKGMLTEKHEVKHSINPWADIMDEVTKTASTDELPNRSDGEVQR